MSEPRTPPQGSGWFWVDDAYWESGGLYHFWWPDYWEGSVPAALCGGYRPCGEVIPEEDTGPDVWDKECKHCSERLVWVTDPHTDAWAEYLAKKNSPDRS